MATIDALLAGVYDGHMSLATLRRYGDFGIGTFEGLDGEAVLLDGVVYQVKGDGSVVHAEDAQRMPFGSCTLFDEDIGRKMKTIDSFEQFGKALEDSFENRQIFYAIKAHGLFGYLKHFLGPMLVLAPLMFLIEMIGNFARALSLSMRLYGNIFGEHTAGSIFASLVPIVVPWPMMALGIFTALLQAYVFTLLTTVYLGGATAHEH